MTYSQFLNHYINAVVDSGHAFQDEIPPEALSYLQDGLKAVDVIGRFPQDSTVKACCK